MDLPQNIPARSLAILVLLLLLSACSPASPAAALPAAALATAVAPTATTAPTLAPTATSTTAPAETPSPSPTPISGAELLSKNQAAMAAARSWVMDMPITIEAMGQSLDMNVRSIYEHPDRSHITVEMLGQTVETVSLSAKDWYTRMRRQISGRW